MKETDPHGWLRPALYILAAILLLLLAAGIPGHHVHIDEAWIGEQAYTLATDGYVHSNLFEGLARVDERSIVYHRLFVRAGSLAIDLFGWSVGALRVVPLACGALLLALMFLYCRDTMKGDRFWAVLPGVILLLVPLCFEFVKIYRPEFMTAMFGFASFFALHSYLGHGRWQRIAICGVAGGAAALAHPYGLVYPVAAFLLLALMRRWRHLPLLVLATTVVLLPYAVDILANQELVRLQLANPIVADKTHFGILTPFINLLDEHKRLFRTIDIIPISVLFLLSLLPAFGDRSSGVKLLHCYTLILVVLLGMLTPDKLTRYGIVLFPFFAISIAWSLRMIVESPESRRGKIYIPWLRASIPALLFGLFGAILFGYGIFYAARTSFRPREDPAALNREIARNIPAGSRIVAPMNFLFEEIGNYHIIALRYANYEQSSRLPLDSLLAFAGRHRANAIVFNRYQEGDEGVVDLEEHRERLGRMHRVVDDPNGGYSVVLLK